MCGVFKDDGKENGSYDLGFGVLEPQKYVQLGPLWLSFWVEGCYFAYRWGLGNPDCLQLYWLCSLILGCYYYRTVGT